jgi:DNA-binding XRE family transcriptional regulator
MVTSEQIKITKAIGKRLRQSREEGGFNLAIVASKLNFSVVELVAIEDGNVLPFDKDILKYKDAALRYAREVDTDLSDLFIVQFQKIRQTTAKDWDVSIPVFLRKRSY